MAGDKEDLAHGHFCLHTTGQKGACPGRSPWWHPKAWGLPAKGRGGVQITRGSPDDGVCEKNRRRPRKSCFPILSSGKRHFQVLCAKQSLLLVALKKKIQANSIRFPEATGNAETLRINRFPCDYMSSKNLTTQKLTDKTPQSIHLVTVAPVFGLINNL